MLKSVTVKQTAVGTENSRSAAVSTRIVKYNHESRANKLSTGQLKDIAKQCYAEYVSPFDKIRDC